MSQQVILFDINETVLDLASLKPKFQHYFGDELHMSTWFAMLLHSSTVCVTTSVRSDFKSLARAALLSLAGRVQVSLSSESIDEILATFAQLAAHDDIVPAMQKLRQAGFKLVALSNSSLALLNAQLTNAGIITLFDEVISVETAATFKPAAAAYQLALSQLSVPAHQARLVAAHDWDTHGALCAGLHGAFVDRLASPYHPLYKKPDIMARSMIEVADQIIKL